MTGSTPHARLRSPEPIGVGTGAVESMTSYIARLAERLRIPVSGLIAVLDDGGPILGDADWLGARGHAANGCRDVAERAVAAVGRATLRPALAALTLRRFAGVLPDWELLRPMLAWCPACLREHRYEHLAWSLQIVRACVAHRVPLVTACPECGREQPPLTAFAVVGMCRSCAADLAAATGLGAATEWDLACAAQVEDLLCTSGDQAPHPGALPSLISMAAHAETSLTALVLRAGLARSAGTAYRRGTLPSIEAWTRMAIAAGASLRSAIEGSPAPAATTRGVPASPWGGKRRRDWEVIRAAIEEVLLVGSEASLRRLAVELGATEAEIRDRFPALTAAVVNSRLLAISERATQRLVSAIAEVERVICELADDRLPPSRRNVEARIGGGLLLREESLSHAWRSRA